MVLRSAVQHVLDEGLEILSITGVEFVEDVVDLREFWVLQLVPGASSTCVEVLRCSNFCLLCMKLHGVVKPVINPLVVIPAFLELDKKSLECNLQAWQAAAFGVVGGKTKVRVKSFSYWKRI